MFIINKLCPYVLLGLPKAIPALSFKGQMVYSFRKDNRGLYDMCSKIQTQMEKQEEGDRWESEPSTAGVVSPVFSALLPSRLTPSPDLTSQKNSRDCQYSPGSISLRSVKALQVASIRVLVLKPL